MGFRVQGLGFRVSVQGSGFGVWDHQNAPSAIAPRPLPCAREKGCVSERDCVCVRVCEREEAALNRRGEKKREKILVSDGPNPTWPVVIPRETLRFHFFNLREKQSAGSPNR